MEESKNSFEITDEQKKLAEVYSEGNENFKNLLITAWQNNVGTFACCNGHIRDVIGYGYCNYIAFHFSTDEEALIFATNMTLLNKELKHLRVECSKDVLTESDAKHFTGTNLEDNIRRTVDIYIPLTSLPFKDMCYKKITENIANKNLITKHSTADFEKYYAIIKDLSLQKDWDMPYANSIKETRPCSSFLRMQLTSPKLTVENIKNSIRKTSQNFKHELEL